MSNLKRLGKALGRQLRLLRQRKNLRLEDVAKAAGRSPAYLSKIERGLKLPSFETLLRLSQALKLSRKDLLSALAATIPEKCSTATVAKETSSSGKLQAVLVTVGHYLNQTQQLEILSRQLSPLLEAEGLELSEPFVITAPYEPRLKRLTRQAALIIDATGLFRGGLRGFNKHPFTAAGLVAASYNIPYILLCRLRRNDVEAVQISGWSNVYRTKGYFSEVFYQEKEMLKYLQEIIIKEAVGRWK
jgi:transcriptional regulator with XRE-family HTH domain